jgi:hypothetical protein
VLEKKTSHTSEGAPPNAVFTSADPVTVTSKITSADHPAETSTPDGAATPLNFSTISSRTEKNASMIPGMTWSMICYIILPNLSICTERAIKNIMSNV